MLSNEFQTNAFFASCVQRIEIEKSAGKCDDEERNVELGYDRPGLSVCVVWRRRKVRTRLSIWRCTGRKAVAGKIKASKRRIVHVQRLIGWVFSAVSNKRKKKKVIADEVGWIMEE